MTQTFFLESGLLSRLQQCAQRVIHWSLLLAGRENIPQQTYNNQNPHIDIHQKSIHWIIIPSINKAGMSLTDIHKSPINREAFAGKSFIIQQ
jgi:hypothetical protein